MVTPRRRGFTPRLAIGQPYFPGQSMNSQVPGSITRPGTPQANPISFAQFVPQATGLDVAAQTSYLRNASDRDFGRLGINPPADVRVPEGVNPASINFGAFARPDIPLTIPAPETPQAPIERRPVSLLRPSQAQAPRPEAPVTAPRRERAPLPTPEEMRAKQEETEARIRTQEGKVQYQDPFTGQREWVYPAEAKIRTFGADKRIKEEAKRRYPESFREFEKLSDDELVDVLLNPIGIGEIPGQEAYMLAEAELRTRGMSNKAIQTLKTLGQRRKEEEGFKYEPRKKSQAPVTPQAPETRESALSPRRIARLYLGLE